MTPARPAHSTANEDAALHWKARLQLELQHLDGKTRLARCAHFGPLRVQRPFYPDGPEQAHLYLLHPPGGLVAGDQLGIDITLHAKARALCTTPSAGKIYNNITAREQQQRVHLQVANDACLEWLPQETILFNGAKGRLQTEVHLSGTGCFIGWEIVCLGRPHGGHGFDTGYLKQRFAVYRDGAPLWLENNTLHAGSATLMQRFGFNRQPVYGTLVLAGSGFASLSFPDVPAPDSKILATAKNDLISITQKKDITLVRYLGSCTEQAKNLLAHYWCMASAQIHGKTPSAPRIWHT